MIKALNGLVQHKCGVPAHIVLNAVLGELEGMTGEGKPVVEVSARFGLRNLWL